MDLIRYEIHENYWNRTINFTYYTQLPTHINDYAVVEETLAHWRFHDDLGENDGAPVDTNPSLLRDISGNGNDLYRVDIEPTLATYLTYSRDHHPLSSSTGSICFTNPTRDSGSYLTSTDGGPLSYETFPNGYTVEAFVKLNSNVWSSNTSHRWTAVLSRNGEGQDSNKAMGDLNEPLATFGFSPSREVQWATFPRDSDVGIVTAWSSPVQSDTWAHFAAVNDGRGHVTLYINGYPARRDPYYQIVNGISIVNMTDNPELLGWNVGSSTYNKIRKIFGGGCIGEIRITGRPLDPTTEFLISRPGN
jgi:hypothetical protein